MVRTEARVIETDEAGLFPRHVRRYNAEGEPKDTGRLLTSLVTERERSGDDPGHRTVIVDAAPSDGLTTAAAQVAEAARTARFDTVYVLSGVVSGPGQLPALQQLFTRRQLLAAARRSDASTVPWLSRPATTAVWAAILVIAGIVLALAKAYLEARGPATDRAGLLSPGSLGTTALIVVVGLVSQEAAARIRDRRVPDRSLAEDLAPREPDVQDALVTDLVRQLRRFRGRRCVVVDDVDNLDVVTRNLVSTYAQEFAEGSRSEVWVLIERCEGEGRGKLWVSALRERVKTQTGTLRTAELCVLEPLGPAERAALAERVRHPTRAGYLTVGAIVRGDMRHLTELLAPFRCSPEHPNADPTLEAAYLLALTATSGRNITFAQETLVDVLEQGGVARLVLDTILPGMCRRDDIECRLGRLQRDFAELLDPGTRDRLGTIRIDGQAAGYLIEHASEFGLPDAAVGHLFWALCWHEQRRQMPVDALYVQKTAEHLRRAVPPTQCGFLHGAELEDVTTAYFDAVAQTITQCLMEPLPDAVVPLLERARTAVHRNDPDVTERRRRCLDDLVWEAYAVLGHDRILACAGPVVDEEDARRAPSACTFDEVFWSSQPTETRMARPRPTKTPRADAPQRLAVFQGAHLVLALGLAMPGPWSELARLYRSAPGQIPGDVEAYLAAVEDSAPRWGAVEPTIVSLGLWCWALSFATPGEDLAGDPADRLRAFSLCARRAVDCLTALGARLAPRGPKDDDFLMDALHEEAQLIVAASGLLALEHWDAHAASSAFAAVGDVVAQTLGSLQIVPDPAGPAAHGAIAAVARRMQLLRVAWRCMGLETRSSGLAIMRAELEARSRQPARDVRPTDIVKSLSSELGMLDRTGCLANLVAAHVERDAQQLVARFLIDATRAASMYEMAPWLRAELAFTSLLAAHSFSTPKDDLLELLLDTDDEGGSPAERLLARVPDAGAALLSLCFLNAAADATAARHRHPVAGMVRARASLMADPARRQQVVDHLDEAELRWRVDAGHPVDAPAVIAAWSDRRTSLDYPMVLRRLLDSGDVSDVLRHEVEDVIPRSQEYTGATAITILLEGVATRLATGRVVGAWRDIDRSLLVSALRTTLIWNEARLSAKVNIAAFTALSQLDPASWVHDREHLQHWQEIDAEAQTERLPLLLSEGRFAILFLYYVHLLAGLGLPVDANPDEDTATSVSPNALVLAPFVGPPGAGVLSAGFVHQLEYCFEQVPASEGTYTALREGLNQASKGAIENLLHVTVPQMSGLPASLRSILKRHEALVVRRLSATAH